MITIFIEITFLVAALALFIPALVFTVECLAAWLPSRTKKDETPPTSNEQKVVVLVPAHNEESGITEALQSIREGLGDHGDILVVADNCTDSTAQVAKAAGAEVIERESKSENGKGYAMAFGLEHLKTTPPDVVVVVDADCRVEPKQLLRLAATAHHLDRPVQGEYLLETPADPTPKSRISGFAVLVKNHVRALGLRRLGLPCQLTGSGMAFPWALISKAPATNSYLVEDMLLGLEMARQGYAPRLAPEIKIRSVLPKDDQSGQKQRRRWEHGHLQTIATYGVPSIIEGFQKKNRELIAIGLDLMVPPLAFLVVLLLSSWVITGLAAVIGYWSSPYTILTYALCMVIFSVFVTWLGFGRTILPPEHLGEIPKYIGWKLPLYLSFLRSGSHQDWERTDRTTNTSEKSNAEGSQP